MVTSHPKATTRDATSSDPCYSTLYTRNTSIHVNAITRFTVC